MRPMAATPFCELLGMTPLAFAGLLCAATAALTWLASVLTGNYSQVDRLWSILPPIYVGVFAAAADFADPRLDVMLALTALWGARLTYNFARKGGYRPGGEDYRWPILRQRMSPALFQLFNATFIAPFQNALLLGLALPAHLALQHRTPLTHTDLALAALFLALLAAETLADQQQWEFHLQKAAAREAGEPLTPPFLTTGLFRYSRHPNYFCEISLWWVIYAFSVSAGAPLWNVTILGAVVLTLLFQGSTQMTEQITLSKYPAYADYQRRTSRLIPMPPRVA